MRVHLIDGTFELFRCFHATPRGVDGDGQEVGAVRGLVATLASLLRRPEVTHVAVVFDPMAPPRGAASGEGATLRSQGIRAWEAVRQLGIALWPMTRVQADDGLASGARRLAGLPEVDQVVICTTDKDLLQCVRGQRVVVWDRIRDVVHDEPAVRARFGVDPRRIPALFALVGDPSDGLPGVPGFGWKSAAAVVNAVDRLQDLPDDPDQWPAVRGRARLAAMWAERRQEALLGRDLSVLRDDLPVPADLEGLAWRGPKPSLPDFLHALGDPALAEWVPDRLERARQADPGAGDTD